MLPDHKITAFLKTHAMLDDDPAATLSAAQLKAWWDSSPEELRVALNGAIDDIVAGYALKSELNGLVLGQIPDGSIETPKYKDLSITPAKLSAQGAGSGFNADKVDGIDFRTSSGYLEINDGTGWQPVGGVKGVQRGTVSAPANTTTSVTLSAVDMNKSFVNLNVQAALPSNTSSLYSNLTSATNLAIVNGTINAYTVAWEVVEFR